MLSILGNLRINSIDRLNRFKDSLSSFATISDNWVINIRGQYRNEALAFMRPILGQALAEYTLLDDARGWAVNTRDMLKDIHHDYILLWNEDHVNIADPSIYTLVINDLESAQADCLMYTAWHLTDELLGDSPMVTGTATDIFEVTTDTWTTIRRNGGKSYIISMASIFKRPLLEKLFAEDIRKWPWLVARVIRKISHLTSKVVGWSSSSCFYSVNQILFKDRLPRFTKETPFNLEKEPHRTDYLPLRIGRPKQELFACVDDPFGLPGYPLLVRHPEKLHYTPTETPK